MSDILGIGSIVSSVGGWIAGNAAQNKQHQYNLQENEHAAGLNFRYGEKAADNADARARAFYNDFNSPEAIRKQLESAGLSVGLMYGGGGAGGQGHAGDSAPQGQGAGGQQGKTVNTAMAIEGALAGSQIRLNEAEANKLNAEAEYTSGVKTENTEAETNYANNAAELAAAETENTWAKKNLTELQSIAQDIQNTLQGETLYWQIEKCVADCEHAREILTGTRWDNYIKGNAADDIIEQYNANLLETYAKKLYYKTAAGTNKSQSSLNFAEAKNALKLFGQQLKLQENKLNTDKYINSQTNATWEEIAEKQANALIISSGINASPKLIETAKDILINFGKKRVPIGYGRGK